MAKAPAFQFYAQDFISDENVVLMSNQEVGCYIKLLCFQWKQGSIPSDINKIAKLCGENSEVMAELWPSIEPCFKQNGRRDRMANPRMEAERKKMNAYRKERSEAGKRGAKKRWKNKHKNGSAIKEPLAKNSPSSSSSSSSSYKDTSREVYYSNKLYTLIVERNPNFKKPNLQNWAQTIDRTHRLDKRSWQDINDVIEWCQKDDFWQDNILSPTKLRNKFDQLFMKMKKDKNPYGV